MNGFRQLSGLAAAAAAIVTAITGVAGEAAAVDTTPPHPLKAVVDINRSSITVSFNEPVLPGGMEVIGGAEDPYKYMGFSMSAGGLLFATSPPPMRTNATNVVLHIDPLTPWIESVFYQIEITSVADVHTNIMESNVSLPVIVPLVFRFGLNGYTGATDVVVSEFTPETPGAQMDPLRVDNDDPNGTGNDVQVLLRFRGLIGYNPGQLKPWALVRSATLTFGQTDPGSPVNGHRVLMPWDESATWTSLGQGISPDGIEAAAQPVFTIPQGPGPARSVDVTAAVQEWVLNPNEPNLGWVLLGTGSDRWSCGSSEHPTEGLRPTLTVDVDGHVDPPPCVPLLESTSISVIPCRPLEIRTVAVEFCPPAAYQWYRNGVAISGATGRNYSKPVAGPADSGNYFVVATFFGGSRTSQVCQVTITGDIVRPRITGVRLDPDLRTIRVDFSEPLEPASAQNVTNYWLQRSNGEGMVVSNAVLINSVTLPFGLRTVVLTTAPRTFGANYVLSISNLFDTACGGNEAPNAIYPNPTVLPVVSDEAEVLGWDAAWKYEQFANLDESGWQESGYDDSLWNTGPGLFGFESTTATLAVLPGPIRTTWMVSAQQPTYYLRRLLLLDNPITEEAVFQMRHTIDDGAVAHVNGVEAFRFNMTNSGPITYTNYAATPLPIAADARLQTNTILLRTGTNVIAVEVHQQTETSGDVLFGAQIIAVLPSPRLTIGHDAAGLAVSWAPRMGVLEESSDLRTWQPSTEQANPHRRAPEAGQVFFRVRR